MPGTVERHRGARSTHSADNVLAFAVQQAPQFDQLLYLNFALWPLASNFPSFMPWQLLTYGFLHGSLMHIAFNMFMLWMFGRELEQVYGPRRFLTYYLTCVVGAGIVQLIVAATQGGIYPTVGASGGVFGLLLLFGMTFPNRMIMLLQRSGHHEDDQKNQKDVNIGSDIDIRFDSLFVHAH